MAVVDIETVLLAAALTVVAEDVVRFMIIAGCGARRMRRRNASGLRKPFGPRPCCAVRVDPFHSRVQQAYANRLKNGEVAMTRVERSGI